MKSLRYLNKYLLKYKWRLLVGILCIAISNIFYVKMPIVVSNTTNELYTHTGGDVDANQLIISVLKVFGIYILLSLGKGVFLFLQRQTIIIMSRFIEFDLKNEIYHQYQQLNFSFYKNNKTGDLMNRISEDVSQVRQYLGPGLMYTINLAVLFAMCVYAMLQINVKLTLITLIPLPIMSYMIYKVSSKMNSLSRKVQEEQSKMTSIVQETFTGIRVIKAYLREKEVSNKFFDSSNEYKVRTMNLVRVNAFFMPTIAFLIGLSTLLSIYVGGLLTYVGNITPGDILAYIMYINMLTWPFASVGWVTSIIQRAAASQERINEFLKIKPEITNPSSAALDAIREIEFKDVVYTYSNSGIKAINGLSFSLKRGETLGIIGKTGSGKSTVLNLAERLMDTDSGEILVNGQNIKTINLDDYRRLSGVVPQEVFLFSDTIGNNIKFGVNDREVPDAELVEITQKAHVYHNIVNFEKGFDTVLGERGVNLSGGQKQRVSIARALIKKPDLLLLDDCLSAVDTETEDFILKSITEFNKDSMTIIVSHRISSLRYADKIIVLEDGKKIEEGSHEELLELNGYYRDIYENQLHEEEE